MGTAICERAVADALTHGRAILKFISANDVGQTGSHQGGFYLPKHAWRMFSPHAPTKGSNDDSYPAITWQDGRKTQSRVIWYGRGTRSEYRLTRFGRDFPWLTNDNVGDLLVLVIISHTEFLGYVLDNPDDIDELTSTLGTEIIGTWGVFDSAARPLREDPKTCIGKRFKAFVEALSAFPPTTDFSSCTLATLQACVPTFGTLGPDQRLLQLLESEYSLFRMAERMLCQNEISRLHKSIDDFLTVASSIMNRRKARAGRSLENHVESILLDRGIPHDMRPIVDGKPDIIIPGKAEYLDNAFPEAKLFVIGLKTTCKDRWRQVLNEARRVRKKHILTVQAGISANQLDEMHAASVSLIVPEPLQRHYPKGSSVDLLSLDAFLERVRLTL
jgi:type II restriction enzyme